MAAPIQRRLAGRRALVVGAGAPLGVECALRLHAEGAELLLVDESAPALEAARDAIGDGTHILAAANGDDDDIRAVVRTCDELWPSVDVLLVATGVLDSWAEEDDSFARWESLLRADLLAPIFYTRLLAPALSRSGHGSVILYGSVDGTRGNPRLPAYSVARGGLVPFTHIAADVLGRTGIRVNCIAGAGISPEPPGVTPSSGRAMWDFAAALHATPLGRVAAPADVAGCVAFLACDDSAYVTGAILTMDGGRTAITPGTAL